MSTVKVRWTGPDRMIPGFGQVIQGDIVELPAAMVATLPDDCTPAGKAKTTHTTEPEGVADAD